MPNRAEQSPEEHNKKELKQFLKKHAETAIDEEIASPKGDPIGRKKRLAEMENRILARLEVAEHGTSVKERAKEHAKKAVLESIRLVLSKLTTGELSADQPLDLDLYIQGAAQMAKEEEGWTQVQLMSALEKDWDIQWLIERTEQKRDEKVLEIARPMIDEVIKDASQKLREGIILFHTDAELEEEIDSIALSVSRVSGMDAKTLAMKLKETFCRKGSTCGNLIRDVRQYVFDHSMKAALEVGLETDLNVLKETVENLFRKAGVYGPYFDDFFRKATTERTFIDHLTQVLLDDIKNEGTRTFVKEALEKDNPYESLASLASEIEIVLKSIPDQTVGALAFILYNKIKAWQLGWTQITYDHWVLTNEQHEQLLSSLRQLVSWDERFGDVVMELVYEDKRFRSVLSQLFGVLNAPNIDVSNIKFSYDDHYSFTLTETENIKKCAKKTKELILSMKRTTKTRRPKKLPVNPLQILHEFIQTNSILTPNQLPLEQALRFSSFAKLYEHLKLSEERQTNRIRAGLPI